VILRLDQMFDRQEITTTFDNKQLLSTTFAKYLLSRCGLSGCVGICMCVFARITAGERRERISVGQTLLRWQRDQLVVQMSEPVSF